MPFTPRSEQTRTAILTAARKLLAERGYEGTTIRAVAAEAGIDPSMVMRYYGSKDGLFAAAVDVELDLPDLAAADPGTVGELLTRQFLALWEHPPTDEILLTLLRSAVADDAVVEKVQQVFAGQVTPAVLRFGAPADAPRRAGLVVSQLLGLALTRYVLRLPPVVALTPAEVVAEVAPTIQRYLAGTPAG